MRLRLRLRVPFGRSSSACREGERESLRVVSSAGAGVGDLARDSLRSRIGDAMVEERWWWCCCYCRMFESRG